MIARGPLAMEAEKTLKKKLVTVSSLFDYKDLESSDVCPYHFYIIKQSLVTISTFPTTFRTQKLNSKLDRKSPGRKIPRNWL
jgi:hypothetical protein